LISHVVLLQSIITNLKTTYQHFIDGS